MWDHAERGASCTDWITSQGNSRQRPWQPPRTVRLAEPPQFFDPDRAPRFLRECAADTSVRKTPRSVAVAAAAALELGSGAVSLSSKVSAGRSLASRRAVANQEVAWPLHVGESPAELLRLANSALDLETDRSSELEGSGSALHFGDAVRISLTGGHGLAILCTAPRGCAREAEDGLVAELAGSGRDHMRDFVAITAKHVRSAGDPGASLRRSTWELFRAEPLDGFQDSSVVHYGQAVRLGQRPLVPSGAEVLLSCEHPSCQGNTGAPYMLLGRPLFYGAHSDVKPDEFAACDSMFRLLPVPGTFAASGSAPALGEPLDRRLPVLVAPVSSLARMHGPRTLQLAARGLRTSRTGASGSSVVMSDGSRDLLVDARTPATGGTAHAGWHIERLVVPKGAVAQCDRRREQAHKGLPRALLGRALDAPPPSAVAAVPSSLAAQETDFSRWDHLRRVLLHRLGARGITGFSWFRKSVTANRLVAIASKDLAEIINCKTEDEGAAIVPIEEVASVLLLNCAVHVSERDLSLLADAFAIRGGDRDSRRFIDADRFTDALRGDPSPGRSRYLTRLYARLQREEGVGANASLSVRWIEERLCYSIPPEVQDQNPGLDVVTDVLATLPVVRAHAGVPRAAWVRWIQDLCFREPDHRTFIALVHRMWGARDIVDEREERDWNFQKAGV